MTHDPEAQPSPGHEHGTDHAHDDRHDDHVHAAEALGPVDRPAWGAGLLGVALGIAVVVAFAIAAGAIR